jgi:hypothetical protein
MKRNSFSSYNTTNQRYSAIKRVEAVYLNVDANSATTIYSSYSSVTHACRMQFRSSPRTTNLIAKLRNRKVGDYSIAAGHEIFLRS